MTGKEIKDKVSDHACVRYAQRAMEMDIEDEKDLNPNQYILIGSHLIKMLMEKYPMAFELITGSYTIDGIVFVVADSRIITIKDKTGRRRARSTRAKKEWKNRKPQNEKSNAKEKA